MLLSMNLNFVIIELACGKYTLEGHFHFSYILGTFGAVIYLIF